MLFSTARSGNRSTTPSRLGFVGDFLAILSTLYWLLVLRMPYCIALVHMFLLLDKDASSSKYYVRFPQSRSLGQVDRCMLKLKITSPSRTGDIELKLTVGVHGPGELHLVLLDEPAG